MKKNILKNRTLGFYIGLITSIMALITSFSYALLGLNDRTFSLVVFILAILGSLSELLILFTKYKFTTLIPLIFFGTALGIHLYHAAFPLADLYTGIKFFGGNVNYAIAFSILFAIISIGFIISNFMKQHNV